LTISEAEIRRHVKRVLASAAFRGSKRSADFLRFTVECVLRGDTESLKERTLAAEVFGRPADADLSEDAIVRVGAREVRRRLAQFYVEEGIQEEFRIHLPSGCYVPTFDLSEQDAHKSIESAPPPDLEVTLAPSPVELPATPLWRPRRLLWLAPALLLLSAVLYFAIPAFQSVSAFERFWAPALHDKSAELIVLAHPQVFLRRIHPSVLPDPVSGATKTEQDFLAVHDQYAGIGDAIAVGELAAMLTRHSKPFRVRVGSQVEFTELRDSPAVLIGAYTNRWTMELTKNLRFRFEIDRQGAYITDATDPKQRWESQVANSASGFSPEEYILICRMPHSVSGGFTVICAGLTHYGTETAGRLVAQPALLEPVLQALPRDWPNKNLEVVLHASVLGNASTSPKVVAAHLW
jgi:hypothetical protein